MAVLNSYAFADLIYVDRMYADSLDMLNNWYTYDTETLDLGAVNFLDMSDGFQADGQELALDGFALTFSSDLLNDYSTIGGRARGTFNGGVTVTLSGTVGTYSGVLLEGAITETSFELEELYTDAKEFDGQVHVDLNDAVGLAAGISIGDGHTYKILDPRIDMFLRSSSDPDDFLSEDLHTGFLASSVHFVAPVPEPMTVMLLGVGALFLRRRK